MKLWQKFVAWLIAALTVIDFFGTAIFVLFPRKYINYVDAAAAEFNVEPALIYSIIKVESGFNPNVVSNAGAVGLMQIKPQTAQYIALLLGAPDENYDLTNPESNIRFGTFYIKYLLDKFGDKTTALAAYNAGEGVALGWINNKIFGDNINLESIKSGLVEIDVNQVPYKETRDYIRKVMAMRKVYKFLF